MDVLSEVLDTLQLRSTGAEAFKVEGLYRAVSPKRQVLAHIVMSGACTLEVDGGTGPLTSVSYTHLTLPTNREV